MSRMWHAIWDGKWRLQRLTTFPRAWVKFIQIYSFFFAGWVRFEATWKLCCPGRKGRLICPFVVVFCHDRCILLIVNLFLVFLLCWWRPIFEILSLFAPSWFIVYVIWRRSAKFIAWIHFLFLYQLWNGTLANVYVLLILWFDVRLPH